MFTFPSLEWFQELGRLMNENEAAFKRFGYADVTWALEVQPSSPAHTAFLFRFVFEEYSCSEVVELEPDTDADADMGRLHEGFEQALAIGGSEFLGIANARWRRVAVENQCSGDHRAGKRASAGFVDPRDDRMMRRSSA